MPDFLTSQEHSFSSFNPTLDKRAKWLKTTVGSHFPKLLPHLNLSLDDQTLTQLSKPHMVGQVVSNVKADIKDHFNGVFTDNTIRYLDRLDDLHDLYKRLAYDKRYNSLPLADTYRSILATAIHAHAIDGYNHINGTYNRSNQIYFPTKDEEEEDSLDLETLRKEIAAGHIGTESPFNSDRKIKRLSDIIFDHANRHFQEQYNAPPSLYNTDGTPIQYPKIHNKTFADSRLATIAMRQPSSFNRQQFIDDPHLQNMETSAIYVGREFPSATRELAGHYFNALKSTIGRKITDKLASVRDRKSSSN